MYIEWHSLLCKDVHTPAMRIETMIKLLGHLNSLTRLVCKDEVTFLTDISPVPWMLHGAPDLCPVGLYVGHGVNGLEVAVARSAKEPTGTAMTTTWKARKGKRASPLLLVVLHSGKATLTGPTGETPPIYKSRDAGQVERICR